MFLLHDTSGLRGFSFFKIIFITCNLQEVSHGCRLSLNQWTQTIYPLERNQTRAEDCTASSVVQSKSACKSILVMTPQLLQMNIRLYCLMSTLGNHAHIYLLLRLAQGQNIPPLQVFGFVLYRRWLWKSVLLNWWHAANASHPTRSMSPDCSLLFGDISQRSQVNGSHSVIVSGLVMMYNIT